MADENCWELQKEEVLLLKSMYCGEGECLVTCVSNSLCFPPSVLSDEALIRTKELSDNELIHISIRLNEPGSSHTADVEVKFTLPKGYPKYEPPIISIAGKHIPSEHLIELSEQASTHSKALLPGACLYDTLQKIKDNVMSMRSYDPVDSYESLDRGQRDTLAASQNLIKSLCVYVCVCECCQG